ncbi:MAG: NUDIX domain-containing protein [Neisseriaceae bacterium]
MLNIILAKDDIIMCEREGGTLSLPNSQDVIQLEKITEVLFVDDSECVVTIIDVSQLPSQFKLMNILYVLNHVDFYTTVRIIYYQQLFRYYTSNVFCGSCGSKTDKQLNSKFVYCNVCEHEIYPHIAPCIMVRIHKDDEILMARGVNFPPGRWGLIAGFVEIGETLEEAVIREVKEEVGLEISDIKYCNEEYPIMKNILLCKL